MKLIAIIPARGGSKRLPGKNLMDLGGIPLLAHSILYAQAQPQISAVYVTTNDTEIARVAMEFGAGVINRPEAISGDFEPTVSALAHALEVIGESDPVIVLLQPTNPLRPKMLFQECLSVFEQKQTGSLFTVSRNHHKFGTISKERFIPYNYSPGQRSQDLEPLFYENGLLYISRAEAIRTESIITNDAVPFIVDHVFGSVDIDTAADFDYARYLLKSFNPKE